MSSIKLSLFQNWVLFILFKNSGGSLDPQSIMLQCCDTALDDLTPEKMTADLYALQNTTLIKNIGTAQVPQYRLTPAGILHVRKNLIKPLTQIAQHPEFLAMMNKINTDASKYFVNSRDISYDKASGQLDKIKLSQRLVDYAVNNIGPYIGFLNIILQLLAGLPKAS